MRRIRDGDVFTQDELDRAESELETPEPTPEGVARAGRLQGLLGGLGETWDTDKIPPEEWRRSSDG